MIGLSTILPAENASNIDSGTKSDPIVGANGSISCVIFEKLGKSFTIFHPAR